jgi:hypothetical protein
MFTMKHDGDKMENNARVGDPPHIVRAQLLMRKKTLSDIAREIGCSRNMIQSLLSGRTSSNKIEGYINRVLEQPVETS